MRKHQRGNVYLEFALLAFGLVLAGALLTPLHKAFALLLPLGVLVFFLPNLIALANRVRAVILFRRQLATARAGLPASCLMLRNEFHGLDAQALVLDTAGGTLCFVAQPAAQRPQGVSHAHLRRRGSR